MSLPKHLVYSKLVGGGSSVMEHRVISREATEIISNAPSVGNYAFYTYTALTKAVFPEATSIGAYAFQDCTELLYASAAKATRLNTYAFEGCTKLEEAYFPEATSLANKAFYGCKALKTVYLPKAESLAIECFAGCASLERLDFSKQLSISRDCFDNCTSLTTLIFRGSKMSTVANNHPLDGTPIANGTGYIYVPAALIGTYTNPATNWSPFAAQFRAIEDYPEITGG